jgi:hypothetical protein
MSPADERQEQPPRRVMAVVLTAVVALAAAGLVAGTRGGGGLSPEQVVGAYLAAVRRGEVEQALRIAGDPDLDAFHENASLLTAEVLSDGWTVGQVVRRYPWHSGLDAVVDVTLSTPDGLSAQGRFRLSRDLGGRWSIDHPFDSVPALPGSLDHVEINGVVRQAGVEPVVYLLFPGVYRGWTSVAGLFAGGMPTIVALPGDDAGRLDAPSELSPTGRAAAQRAVNAHLDGCAESTSLKPPGCPFAGGDYGSVDLADEYYLDPADLAWEVVTYPEVLPVPGSTAFGVVPRHEGTVRLTGTGSPLSGDDDDREAFSVECAVDVTRLHLRLTRTGEFEVSGGESFGTC